MKVVKEKKTNELYKHCFGQIVYRLCNHVKLKTESSAVIVTDILVGGNRYNYFVKFVVKNKKRGSFGSFTIIN